MERKILFRGKRVDNGEWAYGCLQYDSLQNIYWIVEEVDDSYYNGCENVEQSAFFEYQVISKTVGLFTGQCDKNGKKIFEGDIILHSLAKDNYIVIWKNGQGFRLDRISQLKCNDFYLDDEFCFKYAEVIGNIFDNVDLLEM